MSFSLDRLNMFIVIRVSHLVSFQFVILPRQYKFPNLGIRVSKYFETHRNKLSTVLPERIDQTISLISRLNNKEFMNVKHK